MVGYGQRLITVGLIHFYTWNNQILQDLNRRWFSKVLNQFLKGFQESLNVSFDQGHENIFM